MLLEIEQQWWSQGSADLAFMTTHLSKWLLTYQKEDYTQ